jgi:lysyl-tRNA synthetase class 2
MSRIDDTIQARIEKRNILDEQGILVHPYSFDKKQMIADCLEKVALFDKEDQEKNLEARKVKTAGRLMALRTHGKVAFADLKDQSGLIQIILRVQEIGQEKFDLLTAIDTGDFLGVEGEAVLSRTDEPSIMVKDFEYLGKSLRPMPSSFNAAKDKDVRFRKRYVDLLINDEARKVMNARWTILREIRNYLQNEHNFTEVETPVLQELYGGTNAKPFTTHMNALDHDYYLRVAPELYLKRLVVAGYEKVFEIARNFRNEGIDQTHQPEFTMIEWYESYADYHRMMDVAEDMIRHVAKVLHGNSKVNILEQEIDLGKKWDRISMAEAIKKYLDIDLEQTSDEQLAQIMEDNNLDLIGEFSRGKAIFAIFDKLVPDNLIQPTWIIDYPKEVSPLAKLHRDNPDLVERFEGYICGKEVGDGWSELVDPVEQRRRFEEEQRRMRAGDDEAHPVDEDFIEAMEYGLPPLGGIGIGIDRLVMFLTNTWSIREVISFPTLKPKNQIVQEKTASNQENSPKETKVEIKATEEVKDLPSREEAEALLEEYIENEALRHHCLMVATAMEAYAKSLGEDAELWYQTGLLHDLDWEKYPDEHPNRAISELLNDYPQVLKDAVAAHAPARTGKEAVTLLDRYLFACDELSGLMNAVSLMRPNGFSDMKVKSVKKKIKDKSFAANVSRDDINKGFELIEKEVEHHIQFLIDVFKNL